MITVQFPNASQVFVKSKLLRVLLEKMPWDRWLIIIYRTFLQNQCILLMERILHQLIRSSPHYLQGFVHPRWFSRRISESTVCHPVTSRFFSFGLVEWTPSTQVAGCIQPSWGLHALPWHGACALLAASLCLGWDSATYQAWIRPCFEAFSGLKWLMNHSRSEDVFWHLLFIYIG